MPIVSREDAADVEEHIARVFSVPPPKKPDELRALFVEKMDFAHASGHIGLASAPKNVVLPTHGEHVAAVYDGKREHKPESQ